MRQRLAALARSESGFTLVEILIGVAILGTLMGTLCLSILVVVNNTSATEDRLGTSHDVQMLDTYFSNDVKNSGSQLGPTERPILTAKPSCASPTATVDTPIVTFAWRDSFQSLSDIRQRWAWYYLARPKAPDGSADMAQLAELRRGYCVAGDPSASTDIALARYLGGEVPQLWCDALRETGASRPCTGVTPPKAVALRLALRLDSSQSFFVQGTRRVGS